MDVDPALLFDGVAFIWPVLRVCPLGTDCKPIHVQTLVEVVEHADIIIYIVKITLDKLKGELYSYKELYMLFVKAIDVVFRIEPPVHDKPGLSKAQDIQIFKEMFYRPGIRDVAGELAIVERQSRFLPKYKKKVYLREMVILLVPAPLDLVEGFGIT